VISDFIIIVSGVYIAYLIRFLGIIPPPNFLPFIKIWYLFGIIGVISLYYFGLYKTDKNFTKKEIWLNTLKAITLSTLIMMDFAYIIREQIMLFPSSIFFISFGINTFLCAGWRVFMLND